MKIFIHKVIQKMLSVFSLKLIKLEKGVDDAIVHLAPERPPVGSVLIGYIIEPFLLSPDEAVSNAHTHDWESLQIARTFVEMGYAVDVISYRNETFVPEKNYSVFIAARTNFERIACRLNEGCISIVHLDTAHWLFNNSAACSRLYELQSRRGVTLYNQKMIEENWAIEHADCATVLGNQFTIETYEYAKKPIYRVPISSTSVYPWNDEKDYQACKKRFLWLGSTGFVHKGLSLVLETFATMPDYHLTVCGPVEEEQKFKAAFYNELFETPNIETAGWVDVDSEQFIDIANNCAAVIYPSCSEGGGGSVITCMHAGLIPVVSYESSVDVEEFGILLKDSTISEVRSALEQFSALEAVELKKMSRQSWEYARNNHTRETFADSFRQVISGIIADHPKSPPVPGGVPER